VPVDAGVMQGRARESNPKILRGSGGITKGNKETGVQYRLPSPKIGALTKPELNGHHSQVMEKNRPRKIDRQLGFARRCSQDSQVPTAVNKRSEGAGGKKQTN